MPLKYFNEKYISVGIDVCHSIKYQASFMGFSYRIHGGEFEYFGYAEKI